MAYKSVALHNFRSYSRYAVEFSPGVNIIVGPNGSGKTNLLEALYVLSIGGSFRASERDLITHSGDWFRLEGVWNDQQRVLTYQLQPGRTAEKQFNLDGIKKARITHAQRVPVVLFEPDHLRLLSDSPSMRRDYLDTLLVSLQPDFSWIKHQFERVLLQRNNLLKRGYSSQQLDDYLFAWDIKFAELAQTVVERRLQLIETFSGRLADLYSTIAHKKSAVQIHYMPTIATVDYRVQALKMLQSRRPDDMARGFTTIGPQRDDFRLTLNGAPAETSASRGEMRTLLLALKIVELQLVTEQNDHPPLLLLDDVFSELDVVRRKALSELAATHQTVITTTDADVVADHFPNSSLIRIKD